MSEVPQTFFVSILFKDKEVIGHSISLNPPERTETGDVKREKAPETKSDERKLEIASTFEGVCRRFVSSMESYRKFIPLTLDIAPRLSAALAERKIGDFVKSKGVERSDLSDEKARVFEVDVNRYREFAVHNDEVLAALDGARLLPEVMLIGLISTYDAFLSQLLRVVLNLHEEIVLTSDKAISFSELKNYSSIEQARADLIDREIEAVIRQSHHEQFGWMERRLSVPLRDDLSIWSSFVELCERRNLFTHTGGIVTAQYLSSCKKHGVDVSSIELGAKLRVDSKYYSQAVAVIYELGAKLCHVLWRKFAKHERKKADSRLIDLGFDLIFVRAYALAEAILRFGVHTLKQHDSEKTRKMMIVNLANAIRLQKREDEARRLLESEDWSASSPDFQICVAAVRGDLDKVVRLMREIGNSETLHLECYRSWPVFRGMRTNERFMSAFQETFGEPLIATKTVEIAETAKRQSSGTSMPDEPEDGPLVKH